MEFNQLFLLGMAFVSWMGYIRGMSKYIRGMSNKKTEKPEFSIGAAGFPATLTFLGFQYSAVIKYLNSDPNSMTIKIFIMVAILGFQLSLYKKELFPKNLKE